jgi:ascorbate-specific PTS system EIIC-type component UlaA
MYDDVTLCMMMWGIRVFITNVKGTFFGMSESEEASKRR